MSALSSHELQAILDAEYPAIRKSALAMCGDEWEADDLTQETFVAALGAIHRRPESQPVRAWLYGAMIRIRRNRMRAAVRYAMRLSKYGMRLPQDSVLAQTGDPVVESLQQDQQREELWQRVRQLPAKQMEVVVLRYVEGMRCEEIATIVDAPVATVRSRLHHGMKRLKDRYQREHSEDVVDDFSQALQRTSSPAATDSFAEMNSVGIDDPNTEHLKVSTATS